ncbi:hypothetical protein [Runella aurantiaca]|uniref:RiboL-PSP-HEPN domain-containing protein n=1 Tax=Runella aurantiaca TaxID=2282308 RepID=A0A369IDP8_9BACT|nr:hypothetical protein [Runella aurantiaca]RDB06537.1 hypothetical protein DVG78_07270 [Runella aurantiaca]
MTKELINEFKDVVNENYGIYLDCLMCFLITLNDFEEKIERYAKKIGYTFVNQDKIPFSHYSPTRDKYLHTETHGEFKSRMSKGGKNYNFVGNTFIISVYAFWEDHYRQKIASSMGKKKNELKEPIMGDIRLIRNSLVHHKAIALKEIEECEVLQIFKEGDTICFSDEQIFEIVEHINNYMDKLLSSIE